MIWSRYNFIFISKGNKALLYNSMTNNLVEFTIEDYNKINQIISFLKISKPISKYKRLFKELVDAKFVVEVDEDSINKLKLNSYVQRFDKDVLSLTIAPTLYCNFSCAYCFEENRKYVFMTDETSEKLVEYVLSFQHIKYLSITWYGGEPLLAFKRIKSITEEIRRLKKTTWGFNSHTVEILKAEGIDEKIIISLDRLKEQTFSDEYSFLKACENIIDSSSLQLHNSSIKKAFSVPFPIIASMITNGYLMKEDKIDDLIALNIRKIQITLDGNETTHNQRRSAKTGNSFQTILNNAENLLKRTNLIQIAFRINVDKTNKHEFSEMHNYLSNRFKGKNMFIYPGFIYSTFRNSESCISVEECQMNREDRADFLLSNFSKITNHNNNLYYPRNKNSECMARCINSYLIDARGDIYKCWDDIGIQERKIASLHDKGKDNINTKLLNRYLIENDPYSCSECLECAYLPICGGGCPYHRIHNKGVVDPCIVSKDRINDFLEAHTRLKVIKR
jgi:radical SAM protein with 4Fe4S-binding SPASM domain